MSTFVKTYSGTKIQIPDYDSGCISLLPSFFKDVLLGGANNPLTKRTTGKVQLDQVKNVVFFLVDGFGAKQWQDYKTKFKALQRFEQAGYLSELDSVFPSTTPVALNTLHSGLMPAEHGLMDWWLYIEELDKIIATLPFAQMGNDEMDSLLQTGVSSSILLNNETTFEKYESLGIKTRAFVLDDYIQSTYTKAAYKGSEMIPHQDISGLFDTLAEELNKPQEKPSYNFVYWGGIDKAGHTYGLDSPENNQAVTLYFNAFDTFLEKAGDIKDTLFVISADHGQINVDPKETIYLSDITGLTDLLKISSHEKPILPWGGPREVFLAIQDGQHEKTLSLLHKAIGDHVELLESEDALRLGLFGKTSSPHPDLNSRIGDIIVLPKANSTVWYNHPGEEPFSLNAHHGGLSPAELKVPFGLLRLN